MQERFSQAVSTNSLLLDSAVLDSAVADLITITHVYACPCTCVGVS